MTKFSFYTQRQPHATITAYLATTMRRHLLTRARQFGQLGYKLLVLAKRSTGNASFATFCSENKQFNYYCDALGLSFVRLADVEARQRFSSSSSSSMIVSRTRLPTVGDRAFPVAAAHVWNSLPDLVTSTPSVAA